jgi:hypothetical protein
MPEVGEREEHHSERVTTLKEAERPPALPSISTVDMLFADTANLPVGGEQGVARVASACETSGSDAEGASGDA